NTKPGRKGKAMQQPLRTMKLRGIYNAGLAPKQSTFGNVRNGGLKPHQGWDLAAPVGTPVYAIASGRCIVAKSSGHAWSDPFGFYGRQIVLEFLSTSGSTKGMTLYAFYGHLDRIYVKQNAPAFEGQLIGLTGKSGN